ncbi:hypothetical protein V8F06_012257 [Rhypophila decipiens]
MKFQLTALLLPITGVLATPVDASVSARQPALPRAKFNTTGFRTADSRFGGCDGASVTYSEDNEVATVLLPNYFVTLPTRPASTCHVSVIVSFPQGICTSGTFIGRASGLVNVPAGVTATYTGRNYAISPSLSTVSGTSPDGRFPGPRNGIYVLEDRIVYTLNRPDANNRNITFGPQGELQLQPTNGPSGLLSNQQIIFDIRNQSQRVC